jgi:hypothetical protein
LVRKSNPNLFTNATKSAKGRLASERPPRILKKVFFAEVIRKLKLHMTSETVKFDSPSSPRLFEEIEKVFVEDALEVVIAVTTPLENGSEVA